MTHNYKNIVFVTGLHFKLQFTGGRLSCQHALVVGSAQ